MHKGIESFLHHSSRSVVSGAGSEAYKSRLQDSKLWLER